MNPAQQKNKNLFIRFIMSYSPGDFFHRYELFRLLTLVFFIGVFTSIAVTAVKMQMITTGFTITQFVTLYLGTFLPRFWLLYNRPVIIVVVLVFCFFRFSLLKDFFLNRIEFIIRPKLLDPYVARKVARINNVLVYVLVVYMVLIALPVLHLFNLSFYALATAFTALIFSFLYNNYLQLSQTKDGYEKPLSSHNFPEISYKSASGGPYSQELKEELNRYQSLKSETPVGGDVLNFAAQSKDNKFKGFSDLFNQLEKLFDPSGTNSGNLIDKIYLHNKTSDAIAHAIELVSTRQNPQDTAVIYSDAEFLHVKKAIRTFCSGLAKEKKAEDGEEIFAHQISAEKYILDDSFSEEKYAHGIAKKVKALREEDPGLKKICVVMTHVFYQTGRILQVKVVIDKVKEHYSKITGNKQITENDFKMVYIVDGAQAVGNIAIDEKNVIEACHFYAACTHKWLLGRYSMGILLRNDKMLADEGIKLSENTGTPGEQQYTDRHQLAKSIPFETYVSTSIMLSDINRQGMDNIAKHNAALATSFVKGLYDLNNIYVPVNTDCECGIVTIRVNHGQTAEGVNQQLDAMYHISGDLFEADDGDNKIDQQQEKATDKSTLIRFSFHYFMGESDVNKLLYALLDVAYEHDN